jgi:hypothetical protein
MPGRSVEFMFASFMMFNLPGRRWRERELFSQVPV